MKPAPETVAIVENDWLTVAMALLVAVYAWVVAMRDPCSC